MENPYLICQTKCRTCMSSAPILTSIFAVVNFGSTYEEVHLDMALKECTSIEVLHDDLFPKYICSTCIERLAHSYTFYQQCHDSQKRLQQAFETPFEVVTIDEIEDKIIDSNSTTWENIEDDIDNDKKDIIKVKTDYSEEPENADNYENSIESNCDSQGADTVLQDNLIKETHKCLVCSKEYIDRYSMRRHMKVHSDNDVLKCPICSKQLSRPYDVKRHMSTHSGEKPYNCPVCNKNFTQSSSLTTHLRKHEGYNIPVKPKSSPQSKPIPKIKPPPDGKEPVPHLCPICGKEFKQAFNLTVHLRRHTGDKPYGCTVCSKSFVTSGRLKVHTRVHTGERPYVCNVCGKTFRQVSVATRHKKSHLNLKPFECSTCGKCFTTHYYLTIHKRKHTGERPHECTVCHKLFSDPKNLRAHKRVHSNERPFLCITCGKSFKLSYSLKLHMNTHLKH